MTNDTEMLCLAIKTQMEWQQADTDRIVAAIDRLTSVMALSTLLREGGRQVSPEWVGEYVRVMKAITQLAALDKDGA